MTLRKWVWIWWAYKHETGHINHILQVSFNTEEVRNLVPGPTWESVSNKAAINTYLTLSPPDLNFHFIEGKKRLLVYRKALLVRLKAAAKLPTNLAIVYDIKQRVNESSTDFAESVMEAFQQYIPMDL